MNGLYRNEMVSCYQNHMLITSFSCVYYTTPCRGPAACYCLQLQLNRLCTILHYRYAMKRMRRKFVQQQKKRAEDGRNWKGVYDEEKGGYYGDNNNSRISSKGEGRAAIGKKAKPKRVEINNERLKKKEIRQ